MGCGSRLLIGFFQRWTVEEHIRLKNKEKKKGRRPTVMLMALIHFSGVRPLPSFSSPRPPPPLPRGPGRQSVAAAPPLAEVPQDKDLNLPLLHRVLKAPSAALPNPHPLSPGQGSPASTFFCFTLSSFSPNAFCQEFSCSPASRTSGTSAESMLNVLLKRVRKKKSV